MEIFIVCIINTRDQRFGSYLFFSIWLVKNSIIIPNYINKLRSSVNLL